MFNVLFQPAKKPDKKIKDSTAIGENQVQFKNIL